MQLVLVHDIPATALAIEHTLRKLDSRLLCSDLRTIHLRIHKANGDHTQSYIQIGYIHSP